MVFLLALLIFAGLSAVAWYGARAAYRSTFDDHAPSANPGCIIGMVACTSFIPFPFGYLAGNVIWAIAVYGFLGLPLWRATVLVGYLAVASMLTRLMALGVLGF